MKVAIVGSRSITVENIGEYIPRDIEIDEIISGGAPGIDRCARIYAEKMGIPFREILPQYARFGRAAPIIRNKEIVLSADLVIALWDGTSRGTFSVLQYCRKNGVNFIVHKLK